MNKGLINSPEKTMSAQQFKERYEFNTNIGPVLKDQQEKAVEVRRSRLDGHLVSMLDPTSLEAEYYRRLRHIVERMRMHKSNRGTVIAVCSPGAGDGKTVTSINVAGSLAQNTDAKVLLVELDLRKPFVNMKDYLGLGSAAGPGLDDTMINPNVPRGKDIPWGKVVRYISNFNLYFLPSGSIVSSPYELLKPPRLGELLESARQRYDFIILDTPPVVFLPDSQLIEKCVDGIFLVVAAGRTPKKMLEEALNLMDPEKILGIVFNGHTPDSLLRYGDAYAYVRVRAGLNRGGWWSRIMRRYFTAW